MLKRLVLSLLLTLPLLAFANDWELVREDAQRHITVYTRAQHNSIYDEFYAQTVVPQSLETVVAVLSDINAWPQWLARIKEVKLLKKADKQRWLYLVYKLPYPFSERDAVLYTQLQRQPTEVTIHASSLPNYALPFVVAKKRVRLNQLNSTWKLTPLPTGGTKIELSGRGEPEGFMPALLFNYNLPDEPQQSLRMLRKMLLRPQYATKAEKSVTDKSK